MSSPAWCRALLLPSSGSRRRRPVGAPMPGAPLAALPVSEHAPLGAPGAGARRGCPVLGLDC